MIIAPRPVSPAKVFEDFDFKEAFDVRAGQAAALELRSDAGIFFSAPVSDAISRKLSQTHGYNATLGTGAGTTGTDTLVLQDDTVLEAIAIDITGAVADLEWVRVTALTPVGFEVIVFVALGANAIILTGDTPALANELRFQPMYLQRFSQLRGEIRAGAGGGTAVQLQYLLQRSLDASIPIQRAGA